MTRYADALAALVDRPDPEQLHRDGAPVRARLAELADEHLQHCRYLHERYLRAEVAGNVDGAERALCALTEAGARYRARKAALAAARPVPLSLLEQLLAAVAGTGGSNGRSGAGVHRSPANIAAVDLVTAIRRTIGARNGDLATAIRQWQPADPIAGAAQLDVWAATITALLDPPAHVELWGRTCPACGSTEVREGPEQIRHAALVVVIDRNRSPHEDYAVCRAEACGQRWERARWNLLAAATETASRAG